MSAVVASGTFTTGTGTAPYAVTVDPAAFSGLTPTVLILWWTKRTTAGNAGGDVALGWGISDGTNHRCVGGRANDNVSSTATNRLMRTALIMDVLNASGTSDGTATVSFHSGGFDFDVATDFGADYLVSFLLGGGDITAGVGHVAMPTSATTVDLTVSGFGTCKAVVVGSADKIVVADGIQNHLGLAMGFAASTSSEFLAQVGDQSGLGGANSWRYGVSGELAALADNGTLNGRAQLDSFITDGARLDFIEGAAPAGQMIFLLLGGADVVYQSGVFATAAATGDLSDVTTTGMVPVAGIFASTGEDASTPDTPQDSAVISLGYATGAAARGCIAYTSLDAAGPTQTWQAHLTDAIYCRGNLADGVAALADLASFDSESFTPTMDDAEPSGDLANVGYLVVGEAPASGLSVALPVAGAGAAAGGSIGSAQTVPVGTAGAEAQPLLVAPNQVLAVAAAAAGAQPLTPAIGQSTELPVAGAGAAAIGLTPSGGSAASGGVGSRFRAGLTISI